MKTAVDPKRVIVTAGPTRLGGWGPGTFLEVERKSDTFTSETGADGEHVRARQRDRSGTIVLTLLQSSLSNDILDVYRELDEKGNGGVFPMLIEDLNGLTVFFSSKTYITKPPKKVWSKNVENNIWTLMSADLDTKIGGNLDD